MSASNVGIPSPITVLSALSAVVVLSVTSGCTRPNPDAVNWRCESADDCLDGFVCASRLGACVAPGAESPGLSADTIRVGFVGPLTAGQTEIGQPMRSGIAAYFDAVNREGGVDGRMLELVERDDRGDPDASIDAVNDLLNNEDVFALLGYANARSSAEAAQRVVDAKRIFFAPAAGAPALFNDPPDRYVFTTRASLGTEVEAFLNFALNAREIRSAAQNVGVLVETESDDALTAASAVMLSEVNAALDDGAASPPMAGTFHHRADSEDVDGAVGEALEWIAAAARQANASNVRIATIVLGSTAAAGKTFATDLLDEFHTIKRGDAPDSKYELDATQITRIQSFNDIVFWVPSSVNTVTTAEQLRLAGTFTTIGGEVPYCRQAFSSNVVPDPTSSASGVLRFRDDLAASDAAALPDRVALEGYVNASVLVEALFRAGPQADIEAVVDTIETLEGLDLGTGQVFSYSASDHVGDERVFGSRFADDCGTINFDIADVNDPTPEECPGNICELRGILTEDTTLTSGFVYVLNGTVFVGDGVNAVNLTIEPGTEIRGANGNPDDDDDLVLESAPGVLIVRPNAKIIADGTPSSPIVFTSEQPAGLRSTGDWGGLVINGNAPVNSCANPDTCPPLGEGGSGIYGGSDPDDSSGILRYVRVEYAGILINEANELNGIAFQGVGRGTVIDHVQVHRGQDDGVEFFGGTVDAKHLYVTCADDDSLDWTFGWQGRVQYAAVKQCPLHGDNAIEADNNGDEVDTNGDGEPDATPFRNALPRSSPTLSNVTLVGVPDDEKSDYGALLREGTAAQFTPP